MAQVAYPAELAKKMQGRGIAMQFEVGLEGSNGWHDCKLSDGSECGWNDWFRYRVRPIGTGATNEPKRLQVGKKAVVVRDSCGIFSSGEIVTIVEYESQVKGTAVFHCESENGKTGEMTANELKPYDESRPEQDRGRIQPTESKALRDYQRAQLAAMSAFFNPYLGELYRPNTLETDEQIIARLLS